MSQTEKATGVTVSQTALNSVLNDIRTGNTEYVDRFFAARPDWKDQDEQSKGQEDKKTAQA